MKFLPYGDSAMLINFEQKIDERVNQKVIQLHQAISSSEIDGIIYQIPAYCSLTVGFDRSLIDYQGLKSVIEKAAKTESDESDQSRQRKVKIPVCYEAPYALDLESLSSQTHLSGESIIKLHTTTPFRVYMLGFVAGFAYMGTLPKALECARKEVPRLKVPKGSVGLAGLQTGIYPTEAPGGWQIIGRTPLDMFNPNDSNPSLLQPGDLVQFESIYAEAFNEIEQLHNSGKYELEVSYG